MIRAAGRAMSPVHHATGTLSSMTHTSRRLLVLALLAAPTLGTLPACESMGSELPDLSVEAMRSIIDGEWSLTSLRGQPFADAAAGAPLRQTPSMAVSLADNRVSGSTGVNRWNSFLQDLDVLEGGFDLGPAATTLMGAPPAAAAFERDFLGALSEVRSFRPSELASGYLVLTDASGSELLRFARNP